VSRLRDAATMAPDELGRSLNVSYLVSGSVRRVGRRLRVSVELLRAATGVQAWASQFDRGDEDLLAIQEDIARNVATAIGGRLLPQERANLAARPTRDPAAYDRYLRGNYLLAQRTQQAIARAIVEYQAALRIDPNLTAAQARIAYAYAQHVNWGWPYGDLPPESLVAPGLAAADRALRADSSSSDAWMARGFLLSFREPRTQAGAREAFERAVALDPQNAEALSQYSVVLNRAGVHEEALGASRRAVAVDPTRVVTLRDLGFNYIRMRAYDEARRWLDSALAVDASSWFAHADRARLRLLIGDTAGAREDARAALRLSPTGSRYFGEAVMAMVESQTGDTAGARSRLGRIVPETAGPGGRFVPRAGFMLAAALIGAGLVEQGMEVLERTEPKGGQLWSYMVLPEFDLVRSHPRFQRVLELSRPPGIR
jgi:tetratricopeptide (TPR) repeat protein